MHSQALNVFNLLPALLHVNYPFLPGFLEQNVIHGISNYSLTKIQQDFISDCALTHDCEVPSQEFLEEFPIKGLYSMGSTATLGQNFSSDLDIWVCIRPWVSESQRILLEQKCTLISNWSMELGIEVNFFVMCEERFRSHLTEEMTSDHCGTSQHYILLDEFYRSAMHLAGLPLMWYLVPPEKEHEYEQYIDELVCNSHIRREDWIDFGGLPNIPAAEYFGSSLWQLYKSIDSPYKSVLKAILLEAYSWEYPNTQFLAIECKKNFFANKLDVFHTDAYLMMLGKVTQYLEQIADHRRLDLVRRCFYLKTHEKLSREAIPSDVMWRRDVLSVLVKDWGWEQEVLFQQDNRRHWKIKEVKKAHNELLKALMLSYRNLIRFARNNEITSAISPEDISILARKLYAAFEVLPGKVTLLNTQLASDLHEPNLSFIRVPEDRSNLAGWYLYKQALEPMSIIGQSSLEHNRYISKLIAWAYFNGLLTETTQLSLAAQSNHIHTEKLYQFVSDLRNTFSVSRDNASKKALSEPCEIRKVAFFVNLEQDPTLDLASLSFMAATNDRDIFSFGAEQQSLIGSVDLVYINSWNEVRTLHFKGDNAMLDVLKTLLGKMHQDALMPESVDVFCYANSLTGMIRNQVFKLVNECINMRLNITEQGNFSRYKVLKIADQTFGLFFERRGVSVQKLENSVDFYRTISSNKIGESPIMLLDDLSVQPPEIVDTFASEGLIQFFFEDCSKGFNVYVVDENNRVEVYRQCRGQKAEMVHGLNSFYASSQHRSSVNDETVNFNLPQFYHIVQQDGRDHVIPYKSDHQANTIEEEQDVEDDAQKRLITY